jgi:uncharacterized protein YndB with AHSA1/START domain
VKKTVKPTKSKKVSKPVKVEKKAAKVIKPLASKGANKSAKNIVAKNTEKKSVTKNAVASLKKNVTKKSVAKKVLEKVKSIVKPAKVENKKTTVKKEDKKSKVLNKTNVKAASAEKSAKKEKPIKFAKPAKAEKVSVPKPPKEKSTKKSKGGRKPKNSGADEDEPIIENDILIEQLISSTKRLKKPVKVPKQLRTFTNPMASLSLAGVGSKASKALPKKEPKGKFELEYVVRTSAGILYEFLTSPSGLSEWFADDVNIHDGIFTFFWEGSEQKARLLDFKDEKFVRLQWLDKPEGTFFEFRIEKDDLTGDTSLMIVDFADEDADMQTSKLLWDSQVGKLLNVIGSY